MATTIVVSQQDPNRTLYRYNMNLVNPAYAGVLNNLEGALLEKGAELGVNFRSQWSGVDGAPETQSLSIESPIGKNLGLGVSLVHDRLGPSREYFFDASLSYTIRLNDENSKLSFGFKSGVNFLRNDFSDFNLQSGSATSDPSFANNLNKTFFNFGVGLYYNTDKMYLGFSIPNFIQTKHITANTASNIFYGKEQAHAYFTGGYVYTLNEKVKLKPSFLVKAVSGAPLSYDVNANAIFNDKVEVGLGYRFEDAISGVINFSVSPVLKIGYSYDYNTSALNNFNSGSHEFILLYDFITNLSGVEKSPRYF